MLDAIDASEVVFAVRADGGAGLAMLWAAGVIVGDDRRVEIQDVHRAIRSDAQVDRTEPVVGGTKPFLVLQEKAAFVGRAVQGELLMVDDVEDRLGHEDRAGIFLGPRAAFVHHGGAGCGIVSDLVDLHQGRAIRKVLAGHFATRIDRAEGLRRRARGFREDRLRHDDVLDRVAVRRLAMEELHGAGDFVAEAVAALGGDLLDGRTIRLESEGAGRNADLLGRVVRERRFAAAAVAGVDPAIGSEDEVVGDEVGVARGEASEKDDFLVRLAVAVGIAEPEDIGVGDDDDAVFVMTETGDQLEAFVEELLLVGDAVAVGVDQHADLILGRTVIAAGHEHPAFAPGFGGERTTTIGILRSLGDPHPAALIPLDGDGLVDQRFGGHGVSLETGLHLESGDRLGGTAGAADRITHVHEVLRGAKFVGVGATGRPGDATLDESAVAGVRQGGGVALQEHGGTDARVFEDPSLGLDVIDRGFISDLCGAPTSVGHLRSEGGSEHLDLLVQIEFEDGLIGDVEGGSILGKRMRVGAYVQHHQGAEASAFGRPSGAEHLLAPGGRRPGDRAAQGDETDATVGKVGKGRAVDDLVGGVILSIEYDDLIFVVSGDEDIPRTSRFVHDRAGGMEFVGERPDGRGIVGDDRDFDRRGAKSGGGEDQGGTQEGGDAGKHVPIKGGRPSPTRLSNTPNHNPTPLRCTFRQNYPSARKWEGACPVDFLKAEEKLLPLAKPTFLAMTASLSSESQISRMACWMRKWVRWFIGVRPISLRHRRRKCSKLSPDDRASDLVSQAKSRRACTSSQSRWTRGSPRKLPAKLRT